MRNFISKVQHSDSMDLGEMDSILGTGVCALKLMGEQCYLASKHSHPPPVAGPAPVRGNGTFCPREGPLTILVSKPWRKEGS